MRFAVCAIVVYCMCMLFLYTLSCSRYNYLVVLVLVVSLLLVDRSKIDRQELVVVLVPCGRSFLTFRESEGFTTTHQFSHDQGRVEAKQDHYMQLGGKQDTVNPAERVRELAMA